MDPPGRDELRRRLRARMRTQRDDRRCGVGTATTTPTQTAEQLLLRALGDDAVGLQLATEALRDPARMMRELASAGSPIDAPSGEACMSDDEEAPPPA